MKVKKGDSVIVITGKDKGVSGKILRVFPKDNLVLVEGVNVKKKHTKGGRSGSGKGEIIEKSFPIHASNVKIGEKAAKKPAKEKAAKK